MTLLQAPHTMTMNRSHVRGLIFGFAQAMQFFGWGIATFYGGVLVDRDEITFEDVFKVTNAIIGGAGMVGYSFAFTADFNKAAVAAARVFNLLDRKPLIDDGEGTGLRLGLAGDRDESVTGNIRLTGGQFHYPTRPNVQVLAGMELDIKAGQSVALVGQSGCGKSTIIQLIQRFYNLHGGSLEVEGHNIEQLNVPFIRSKIGIVSQEPVLFDRSIADNIRYGDNSREVGMEEVIEAARKANIHSFVSGLPKGYETRVGGKGSQLSGLPYFFSSSSCIVFMINL
jgi:ATP-binding cassette subfamily B (MDR/TAP) protein 1